MKCKIRMCMVFIILIYQVKAQVGIGVLSPDASAKLHVQSTSMGMLIPRMTSAQKTAIVSPASGLLVYQTDGNAGFNYYNGSAWMMLSGLVVKNGGPEFNQSLLIGHETTGTLYGAYNNLGIGVYTLKSITSGQSNMAIGPQAQYSNRSGNSNIALGAYSQYSLTTGHENIAIGLGTLFTNQTGISNVAIGQNALRTATGSYNNAVGISSLYTCTGINNTALGHISGVSISTGSNNIAIGYNSGNNISTGSNNIAIGYNTTASSATVNNEVTVGNSNNTSYRMFAASWTNASDASYKHDIADIPMGLDFVQRLRPVEFVYSSASNEEKSYGFIAQEVRSAVEEKGLVRSGLVQQMDSSHLGIKTTELIPILTKAIQEQQLQIEEQRKEIENLKKSIGKKHVRR